MPRPRKSEAELRLAGAWRKDRHGPIPPPEGELLGGPPKGLSREIKAAWNDVAECGAGRLVQADRVVVEIAARCLAAIRGPNGRGLDTANLLRSLAALQLDAAHRRSIESPDEDNPFNAF